MWLIGALLLTLLFLRTPVFVALGMTTVLSFLLFTHIPLTSIAQSIFYKIDSFPILAAPLFILCGTVMTHGGSAARLVAFAKSLVSFFPGGLLITGLISCGLFAAISGSSTGTLVAIGSILFPALWETGYDKRSASGYITAGGSLGVLIPPSLAMIIYGVVAGVSIERQYLAGIIPGILVVVALSIGAFLYSLKNGFRFGTFPKARDVWVAFRDAFWILILIFIIFGGIYGGVFTATEAAGVATVYAIVVELVIFRELTFRELYNSVLAAGVMSATLGVIVASAMAFVTFLTLNMIPQKVAAVIVSLTDSKIIFLLLVNMLLLFVGAFVDIVSAIVLIAPILAPTVKSYGIDPIHFAILLVMNLEIGYLTPPVGLNIYTTTAITGIPFSEVTRGLMIPLAIMVCVLLLVTFIPELSLTIPNLVFR